MKSSLRFGLVIASIGLCSVACGQQFVEFTGSSGSGTSGKTSGTGGTTSGTGSATAGTGGVMATSNGPSASSSSTASSGASASSASATSGASSSSGGGVDGGMLGPTATILHPGGDPRPKGVSIYFHGTGNDPTDGPLSGGALVWTDDLEGQFGTGDPVMWAPTVLGPHVITLTAKDSLGFSATDTRKFKVIP